MLQLGGVISSASLRITPRLTCYVTAQHLLSASSIAPNSVANTTIDSYKRKSIGRLGDKSDNSQFKGNEDKSLITAAFKSLIESNSTESVTEKNKDLDDRIKSAKDLNELLNFSKHTEFNEHNASTVIYVLYNWISNHKVKVSQVQHDKRYSKICNVLGINKGISDQMLSSKNEKSTKFVSSLYGIVQAETETREIEKLNVFETIKVLTTLASKQRRSTSVLQNVAAKIVSSNETLNIKQLGDILYSVTVLNFYDEILLKKISQNLLEVISKNERPAVIGSILNSIGFLRYRNEPLLNELSTWIVQNKTVIRPQEINSLLMTLASVGFIPNNFDHVLKDIVLPLQESDMCQSNEWLDIVWALTVLNKASLKHFESVLNNGFLNRALDVSESSTSKTLKLLNINAAATILVPEYKGPSIPVDSKLFDTTLVRTKEKTELSNSIVSALKILLPSDSIYLNIFSNTKMGFFLDAEFCVDNKCTPVPVNSKSDSNKQVFRIAVLTCTYHEFCRGTNDFVGPIHLCQKLLEKQGYKVLLIPYTKVNMKDKLVERVKYINNNIKLLVQGNSMK